MQNEFVSFNRQRQGAAVLGGVFTFWIRHGIWSRNYQGLFVLIRGSLKKDFLYILELNIA
jgi:hypothetical protein